MISIKTSQEIEIMRQGGKILATILDKVAKAVKPGITTKQLDELATQLIFEYGAKPAFLGYENFPAALCTSVNEEIAHAAPSERKLKEGDIIGLDLGILYPVKKNLFNKCAGCPSFAACRPDIPFPDGMYTDMAVTVSVGKVSSAAEKLIRVAKQALEAGFVEIKPGRRIGDLGFAIQKYVEKQGFSVIRNLVGHGIGKKIHEEPKIPNFGKPGTGSEIRAGMTFAIEPMISLGKHQMTKAGDGFGFRTEDRSLAAHFEHTVVVTEKGCEILTKV